VALLDGRLLCVIAHPDDETLGCGGSLARAADRGAEVRVLLPVRRTDPRGLALWDTLLDQFAAAVMLLGGESVVPEHPLTEEAAEADVKALHELVLPHVEWCDSVITHWPSDVHQVHRQVSRAVEIATRPFRRRRTVAFMEVATSTDQSWDRPFAPNLFVELGESFVQRKLDAMSRYASERAPGREREDLERQLRQRGRQIGVDAAEAFVLARSFL
jgi:LmbE family N-acetylglucosaminyl deacetylase